MVVGITCKVAIIGANGQLGSDLVEVFGENAIPLTHADLDVTDSESLKILKEIKPDIIINTAAYVKVDDAELNPNDAFNVNAIGALNVAKISNEINAINVYISTDYVFDGKKNKPYTEEDTPNPINVYGLSKYAGEIFILNYSKRYYIVRVASLYGKEGARGKGGNLVETMIQKARCGEKIKVVSDMFMSPTYTKDVATMLKKFLEYTPQYGIYHMVNDGYCSWYEFAKEIFNILQWDVDMESIRSIDLKRLAKRPKFSALRNTKLEKLGLKMRCWKDALKDYLIEKGYLEVGS